MSMQMPDPSREIRPYIEPPPEVQIAFQHYKELGPRRSIAGLHLHYVRQVTKDAHAPVPSTNIHVLTEWEHRYNWKQLAWEWDAEENNAFITHRKDLMLQVYETQETKADKMLELAGLAMDALDPTSFSPQDTLKFVTEGVKLKREAAQAKMDLDDPAKQQGGATDFFDTVRKLGILQVNVQNNNYANETNNG